MPMDNVTILAACACIVLAALVYLMWKDATAQEWGKFAKNEKAKWRIDEEKRKEKKAA
jgi:hypothetical protein